MLLYFNSRLRVSMLMILVDVPPGPSFLLLSRIYELCVYSPSMITRLPLSFAIAGHRGWPLWGSRQCPYAARLAGRQTVSNSF